MVFSTVEKNKTAWSCFKVHAWCSLAVPLIQMELKLTYRPCFLSASALSPLCGNRQPLTKLTSTRKTLYFPLLANHTVLPLKEMGACACARHCARRSASRHFDSDTLLRHLAVDTRCSAAKSLPPAFSSTSSGMM